MRGATQGRAVWTAEYYGYELLPRELQAQTVKEIRKRKGMPEEVKTWQFFLD
jgi:elongation factor 2